MNFKAACTLLALAPLFGLTLSLGTPLQPMQDGGGGRAVSREGADDWISSTRETHVVSYYACKYVDAYELQDILTNIYGRDIAKLDDEGNIAGYTKNVQVLGQDRVVIFDTNERSAAIIDLCDSIDIQSRDGASSANLSETLVSMEYSPRYLSTNDLINALRPFTRSLPTPDTGNQRVSMSTGLHLNISALSDSGNLIIRDTEAAIAEMSALLEAIDTPSPQVQLVCYVLRGSNEDVLAGTASNTPTLTGLMSAGSTQGGLPMEVTQNLSRLVPYSSFEVSSMGILRMSTASTPRPLSLQMSGVDETFNLSLSVSAFDQAKDVLSFSNFSVMHQSTYGQSNLFGTATSVLAGEYAIMGASGADPIFVVLHFERVGE